MSWNTKILAVSLLASLICGIWLNWWPRNAFTAFLVVFAATVVFASFTELIQSAAADFEQKRADPGESEQISST